MKKEFFENMKAVLNMTPCGIGLFRVRGGISAIYLNDRVFELIGYTREEYAAFSPNPLSLILPEVMSVPKENGQEASENPKLTDSEYQITNKQGETLWIKRNLSFKELDEEEIAVASFVDVTKEQKEQEEKLFEEERYRLVAEQTGVTIFEWNFATGGFYCSPSYYRYEMSKINSQDILKNQGSLDVVHPEDVPKLLQFFADTQSGQTKAETMMRIKLVDGSFRWSRLLGLFLNNRVIGTILDVHEEREKTDMLASILNAIPGGVGLYRLDEQFSPVYFNDRVAELCGMSRSEYEEAIQKAGSGVVIHPDDFPKLVEEAKQALREKRTVSYTYRLLQKKGGYRWVHLSGDWMPDKTDCPVVCAVFTDVNEQILAEQALKESEMKYQMAAKAAGMNIWEYDLQSGTLHLLSNSPRIKPGYFEISNYVSSALENGIIREDCQKDFIHIFEQLKAGSKEVSADIWLKLRDETDYWCERVTYTNLFDTNGVPIKAFGVGRDITRGKEAERRYRHELAYREVMQTATVASINMNLTQNKILDFKSDFAEIAQNMEQSCSAQGYFETVYAQIAGEEMREKCQEMLQVNHLLKCFALDQTSISLELVRNLGGKAYWIVLNAYMMKNAENDDVMAFLYSTDITNEKVMQDVMSTVVRTDYDYLVVVDAIRNSATRYSDNRTNVIYADESSNFEAQIREYIKQYVCPEDVGEILEKCTLQNILAQLDAHQAYSLFYSVEAPDGQLQRKQLRFGYIMPEYKVFLMTRVDITAVYEAQENKNK